MQKRGTVIRWNATRAFGFIQSPGTAADVFFHLRDFRSDSAPCEGLAVVYEEIHVGGKGPRAMAVQPAEQTSAPASASTTHSQRRRMAARASQSLHASETGSGAGLAYLLMLAWCGLTGWGLWAQRLPLWTLAALAGINLATLWSYAADKNAARSGRWRTPEKQLHLLALLGGWPAAWCAQQAMRHKSSKAAFRTVYWLTILGNCAALAGWLFWLWPQMPSTR